MFPIQKKNAIQRPTVSRANPGANKALREARLEFRDSARSTNATPSANSCPMRLKSSRSRGQSAGRFAMKRGDSGRRAANTAPKSSGNTPPATYNPLHPNLGKTHAASTPPTRPPIGIQMRVSFTAVDRRRNGASSALRALTFGNAPPVPIPVMKRKIVSSHCGKVWMA